MHRFPLKKNQETFMTLFFFYTFFALVLKFIQKCLLQYRQTNQNNFNLKTDTIFLEER